MINRYDCPRCGWYADIDEENPAFSTTICDRCGGKLVKLKWR